MEGELVTTTPAALVMGRPLPPVLAGTTGRQVGERVQKFYLSVGEIFERWVTRRSSHHTQRAYRQDVMAFVKFLGLRWPEEATALLTVSEPTCTSGGTTYVVTEGLTPVPDAEQARKLLDSIDTSTVVGLRDRAVIGTMCYTFGRVGALVKLQVRDYYQDGKRGWVRFRGEKGGKVVKMPCHHNPPAPRWKSVVCESRFVTAIRPHC